MFIIPYQFFPSSFSHLELKNTLPLSSIMPWSGLIPVIFGHSERTARRGSIPLVVVHIASSTTPSRSWRSWRGRKRGAKAVSGAPDFCNAYSAKLELQQGRPARKLRRLPWRAELTWLQALFIYYY